MDPIWTAVTAPEGPFTLYKQERVTPVALSAEGNHSPSSLHVDDFAEAAEVLELAGVRIDRGDDHHGAVWDPFGHVLELHDYRKEA